MIILADSDGIREHNGPVERIGLIFTELIPYGVYAGLMVRDLKTLAVVLNDREALGEHYAESAVRADRTIRIVKGRSGIVVRLYLVLGKAEVDSLAGNGGKRGLTASERLNEPAEAVFSVYAQPSGTRSPVHSSPQCLKLISIIM